MGSGPRFPRRLIQPYADRIVERLGDRVVLCGSLRRGAQTCGDVDLVVTDGDFSGVLWELLGMGAHLRSPGRPRTRLFFDVPWCRDGLPVDVWEPRPGAVGACVMHATGPAILNVTMRRWGYVNGLALSWEGVRRLDNGEFIAGETELECAEAVGWPLAEPALRELCLDWMGPFLDELNGAEGQDAP